MIVDSGQVFVSVAQSVSINALPNGITISNADGTVRSCNPDRPGGLTFHWENRPKGTAGPYELAQQIGSNAAVYYPDPVNNPALIVVVSFLASLPNV